MKKSNENWLESDLGSFNEENRFIVIKKYRDEYLNVLFIPTSSLSIFLATNYTQLAIVLINAFSGNTNLLNEKFSMNYPP